jgi:hypothetical protein
MTHDCLSFSERMSRLNDRLGDTRQLLTQRAKSDPRATTERHASLLIGLQSKPKVSASHTRTGCTSRSSKAAPQPR